MNDNTVTVTPTEFLGFLEEHFKTKRPIFVRGGPGVGKSTIIRQFAEARGIGYVDMRVLYYDPTDLKGMPHLNAKERTTEWFTPCELPTEGEGVLVLEELNSAPPLTQAACYQLLFERRDLLTQRRLGNEQGAGCTGHASDIDDLDEIAKLPDFHSLPGVRLWKAGQ